MAGIKPKVLILSTTLLTDRTLLFSSFPPAMARQATVEAWVSSFPLNKEIWNEKGFIVGSFPKINRFKERINMLRRISDFAWSYAIPAISILSMRSFEQKLKGPDGNSNYLGVANRLTRLAGYLFSKLGLEKWFELWLLRKLPLGISSPDVYAALIACRPDILLVTNPMWAMETAVAIEAKRLDIPVLSFIPSWDNITTKNRFSFIPSAFIVWSNLSHLQLNRYYPYSKALPVFEVGAPQYDVFFQEKYRISRVDFCTNIGLNPDLPIVLYALGSPNFIKSEFTTILEVLRTMRLKGKLEKYQVLVRPHPHKQNNELTGELENFHPNVKLQEVGLSGLPAEKRSQNEHHISDWINTVLHADAIINLSSTIILDGALLNKPSLNINFADSESIIYHDFIRGLSKWEHLRIIAACPAVFYCNSVEDILNQLDDLFLEGSSRQPLGEELMKLRKVILNNEDGRSGEKLAMAVISMLKAQP